MAKCKVSIMKISFRSQQTKLIFVWKVLHLFAYSLIRAFIIRLQQHGNSLLLSLKMTFFVGSRFSTIVYTRIRRHESRHPPVISPVVIVFQVVKERTKSAILDFTTGRILGTRLTGNVSFVFKMNPAYWICYFNLSLR